MLPSPSVNYILHFNLYLSQVKLKFTFLSYCTNTIVDKVVSFTFLCVRYLEYDVNGRIIYFYEVYLRLLVETAFFFYKSAVTSNFLMPSSWE